jgi:putative iron-only hydrogenase system regulator
METRLALIGIVVEEYESAEKINSILHEYRKYIIGRMGLQYEKRSIGVISIVLDAPQAIISAISGKLGMLPGVSAKTNTSKIFEDNEYE